jgi:hypothetical protein
MSYPASAASSGAVLGIVLVFLVQQFGLLSLSSLLTSVLFLAVGAIVGGVVFGVAAKVAGRSPAPPATS